LWLGLWEGRLEDWFTLETLGPPGFELLTRSPELKTVVEASFRDAVNWSTKNRPLALTSAGGPPRSIRQEPATVVEQLEGELGRPARDFDLDITVLPVAGRVFWELADGGLIVSENLVRDQRAFRALLYEVLATVV
jgi:hypothetical protein